jgi:hypothetical protein
MALKTDHIIPLTAFTGSALVKARAARLTQGQVNNHLRFALNELKALDSGEVIPGDVDWVVARLRMIADHLETGGAFPDAHAVIAEAAHLPVQV